MDVGRAISTAGSASNFVYNNSLTPSFIIRVFKNDVSIVSQNKAFNKLVLKFKFDRQNYVTEFMYSLQKEQREKLEEYFEKVQQFTQIDETISFSFEYDGVSLMMCLKAALLSSYSDFSYFYIQIGLLPSKGLLASKNFEDNKLFFLLDQMATALSVVDENKNIIFINNKAKELMPYMLVGKSCKDNKAPGEDCNVCPLNQYNVPHNIYIPRLSKVIEVISHEMVVSNKKVILCEYHDKTHHTLSNKVVLDESLSRSLNGIIDYYFEINIDKDSFKAVFYNSVAPSFIDESMLFSKVVGELSSNLVAPKNRLRFNSTFSLNNLKKRAVNLTREEQIVIIGDNNKYLKCVINYIVKSSDKVALVYIKDVTSDYLKDIDLLSGLLNRKTYENKVHEYLTLNHMKKVCFGLLDFNQFKNLNDFYGHPMGDKVLTKAASILKSDSKFKFVSRMGGDEFSFFIDNVGPDFDETKVRNELIEKFGSIKEDLGLNLCTNISIGFSYSPNDGIDFDSLYVKADEQMYENKKKEYQ